jgi:hypothetical protein
MGAVWGHPSKNGRDSNLDFHRTISIVSPANSYRDLRNVTRLREPVKSAAKAAHSHIPVFQFIADYAVKGMKVAPGRCTPRITDRRHRSGALLDLCAQTRCARSPVQAGSGCTDLGGSIHQRWPRVLAAARREEPHRAIARLARTAPVRCTLPNFSQFIPPERALGDLAAGAEPVSAAMQTA